jgi:hypothetical protein
VAASTASPPEEPDHHAPEEATEKQHADDDEDDDDDDDEDEDVDSFLGDVYEALFEDKVLTDGKWRLPVHSINHDFVLTIL